MDHDEFRIVVTVLLVGFVGHRAFYTRRIRHSMTEIGEQPQLGSASQIAGLLALPALLATLVYAVYPIWMSWSALSLPIWARWLGVVIAVGGFVLLQWAQQSLGRNWSDAPVLLEGQDLITSGPYRWIRHPIYTAFLLILGSLLLISENWFVGVMWIGMTGLDVASRINVEEAILIGQFSERYRAYMRRTGRLLPRI